MAFIRNPSYSRTSSAVSTGIPDLDAILGEQMAYGTAALLLEDRDSQIHTVLLSVFLSERTSAEEKRVAVMREPSGVEIYEGGEIKEEARAEKMVIAWRYAGLSPDQGRFRFDLSRKKAFDGIKLQGKDVTCERILGLLERERGLRIAIFSLGSPLWGCIDDSALHGFLYNMRRLVKKNGHVCLVSAPAFLRPGIRFDPFFDVVMGIEAHLFTQFCPNYKAILEMKKMAGYRNFRINSMESMKYGIKVKKELIGVEKIDIPPEDTNLPASCTSTF
jgi:elongator complex protein 4